MADRSSSGSRSRLQPTGRNQSKPVALAQTQVSPARTAAFHILQRVGAGRGHSDDLLHGPIVSQMPPEDRNLTMTLVMGTLRWQIALDARIRPLLQRPESPPPTDVQLALRLGAFQLLHLDRIPAYAALNESVELVRSAGQPQAAGMVNAVLRKLTREPAAKRKLHESTAAFAERLGHPAWLVERWVKQYGLDAAMAVCEFDQHEPSSGDLFAEEHSSGLPEMDAGSRLVAELAAAAMPEAKRIWDCCAAPGGKTLVLATRQAHAEVLATDANPRRLRTLAERLKRVAPEARIRTIESPAESLPADEGEFDLILCDVPCSGTGTLARNPEIRHTLRSEELRRQAERQGIILHAALQRLAPGGALVYSTCSLEPEENQDVLNVVLQNQKHAAFEQVSVEPFLLRLHENQLLNRGVDLSASLCDGHLRTLPGWRFQGDGFFAAILRRSV